MSSEKSRPAQQQQQLLPEFADLGKPSVKLQRGQRLQQQQQQQGRNCARCGSAFGRFYNTGAACPRCRLRVCRQCRETSSISSIGSISCTTSQNNNNISSTISNEAWLCSLCHKIQDLRSPVQATDSRRGTKREHYLTALNILKYSIRRAWTINGPPGRWSASRKSTEFRVYRSLPARRRSLIIEELNTSNNARKPTAHESFIKPPRSVSTSCKTTPQKASHELQQQQQPKKSSIPVFRNRSSREFEDIRGPNETPKRSLIPQRYRGSTDDLRRSREDISIPSFIPKLLSPRNKEDAATRANSQQNPQETLSPTPANRTRRDTRDETAASAELKMLDELPPSQQWQRKQERKPVLSNMPVESESDERPQPEVNRDLSLERQVDSKQELSEATMLAKKIDEPPDVEARKKLSKEELSNDETDEAHRPSSSHLSPEASPLSTRSSKYSPRESESEPTPALPRKTTGERGESSSASQRIRDAITRTRRESNSSAKYESSGSEGVSRLGDSSLSSYVDIARRVKLYGSCGSLGPSTGSCDEVPQRDSATSAGEDEHDDHSRGNQSSQSRMMLRRRRQFDTQGSRRRGSRSHLARSCCAGPEELPAALQQVVAEESSLLDYRRLVFISSDSSSGREEDDADSSCSGSSYLNNNAVANQQQQTSSIEDCDWDYFESNSLKLPQIRGVPNQASQDWSCCPARPASAHSSLSSGCCQACGGSRNAKVLPVPVPIPVPVPYPVPVPASLWTGNESLSPLPLPLSLRGAAVCDPGAAAAAAAASWFSWNPRFDPSSLLLQAQPHFFTRELSADLSEPLRRSHEPEQEQQESIKCQNNSSEPLESTKSSAEDEKKYQEVEEEKQEKEKEEEIEQAAASAEVEEDQKPEQIMFRHSQDQDSRSSSGRSSADSSDLEDSASHRFSRVLVVNDDSLTSDNDIEDNEDSDSAREGQPIILRRVSVLAEQDEQKEADDSVVLRQIRHIDEDEKVGGEEDKSSEESCSLEDEQAERQNPKNQYSVSDRQEIASYDEIYLESSQENEDNIVLLKSIKSIDPENIAGRSTSPDRRNFSTIGQYRAFPKTAQQEPDPEDESKSLSERDDSSNDSAVMPDSLEVSMQDLEDSIESCDVGGALLAAPSAVEGTLQGGQPLPPPRLQKEEGESKCSPSPSSSESSSNAGALSSSDELRELSLTLSRVSTEQQQQEQQQQGGSSSQQISESSAALMAKSRKKWQIPASFDIKGLPSTHFLPPERKKSTSHNPLLSAAADAANELQPEDEENANVSPAAASVTPPADEVLESLEDDNDELLPRQPSESMTTARSAHDESSASAERVRGSESTEQVGGSDEDSSWYRAPVERRTPTRKEENNSCLGEEEGEEEEEDDDDDDDAEDDDCLPSFPKSRRDWVAPKTGNLSLNHLNNVNNNIGSATVNNSHLQANNNKYRSLVMITQAAYQPVNVITSDTTTLLQPQPHEQSRYYQQYAAADANQEAVTRKNGAQGLSKRPLPCKRLLPEPEVDSGLSVGSASESDDVQSVKNATKQQVNSRSPKFFCSREEELAPQPTIEEYNYSGGEGRRGGPLILEEGLADDDSWVEEISHDEDEQSATTGTEESSEDEAGNNLGGDREEELRGYHRQAIDFTLHTIVEESCEESESEQTAASWRRHQLVSASAPDLDKYLFFGLGGSDNGDVDSLSEGSSILSEGLDSLSRERSSTPQNNVSVQEKTSESPSGRLEKYFLSDFLGGEQDRRDSDGSVGSDSEGRPSPEAQRRKRLVRARGTGRSHSSSLDNLLALAHGSQQNHSSGSHQSLQDVALDGQESQSEASSTETDCTEDIGNNGLPIAADGQFDTVKRKKKKLRSNAQSPRVSEDRNKTPEPEEEPSASRSDEDGVKTPQPELLVEDESAAAPAAEAVDATVAIAAPVNAANIESSSSNRPKQQSRDSGFVGSCDDLLLQQPARQQNVSEVAPKALEGNSASDMAHTKDHHQNYHHYHPQKERTERLLFSDDRNAEERVEITHREEYNAGGNYRFRDRLNKVSDLEVHQPGAGGLSRKDSFNNWSSDEETNLMMSKMRQFFKTMVANSNNNANQQHQQQQQQQAHTLATGSAASSTTSSAPSPSPRLSGYAKARAGYNSQSHRTKPPQLVYFENELTRLMKTVPGIRDEQVREIVEYLSSEDTWSDSYDSSDYTSSDLEGATAGGRRSALQEQISQSCQQIINKFDTTTSQQQQHQTAAVSGDDSRTVKSLGDARDGSLASSATQQEPHHYQQQQQGKDTAFVYQKLVQSFTKMAGNENNVASDASSSTPHSSPPLIAKVMHHIGSRLVALMHEVSESNSSSAGAGYSHGCSGVGWSRRYPHHRTPSSASTTEDDDSTSDSASAPLQLPRSKSHDPLLLINNSLTSNVGSNSVLTSMPPEAEEREASDYERFSWRGSFESALMAADSRTKLSLLACSGGDVSASAMAAKRRSAGDLLFNPKSFSREQLDRVRSCGSIGGGTIGANGNTALAGGSIEEKIWSNRRRSSVPDAHNRGESGASAGDEDTEDEEDDDLEYNGHAGDSRATTLPRGMQMAAAAAATNSLPRQSGSSANMHKAHSVYHFLPQQSSGVKSARYRPPGFNRNSSSTVASLPQGGPKRALSAPGLQLQSRSRRHQQGLGGHGQAGSGASSSANVSGGTLSTSGSTDEASSLSEACSTPIIGASSRHVTSSHHASMDLMDDIDRGMHSTHLTRASLSSLGARSDSMASVYSGAGEGRWCGSVAVRGEVEFSLQYDYKQLTFEVHVTQCKDLAPVDVKRNRSDPYVKVYLLPDKSKSGKRKTKVKKHTLNPVFDETLKFHTSLNSLESRTLWLTVWHSDMFGRNDFLGEVRMPLENKIFDDPRPQWYPLQERTEPFDDPVAYKGEVIVGLKFVPPDPARQDRDRGDSATNKLKKSWSRGALHVLVKEARNLQTRAKNSGTCDPFCKSYLLPDKGRSSKQKTAVVRRSTGSPVWNHTFVYKDVSLQELADRGLELTVWDHDRIASNEFLGGVRFNLGTGKHYGKAVDWMDATGREMSLWQSMLERPNFWVEGAVTLRPNLHNHVKAGAS